MKIKVMQNNDLIAELESIKRDLDKGFGSIEQRIDDISHALCMVIDAIIDAEMS